MENNYNKILGRVYSFDGESGLIISKDNIYNFNKKDLIDSGISVGSTVEFVHNTHIFGNDKDLVAVFINKSDKEFAIDESANSRQQ